MKQYKAFSLIEISIVLLIIGFLIVGITQSSRLINNSRLNSAKTLTQSSPVSSVRDLYLWFETTSDKSFGTVEVYDGVSIANWYDINPQNNSKYTLSQSGIDSIKPTYVTGAINGLPAINFGGNDYMNTAKTITLTGNPDFTMFVVAKVMGGDYGPFINFGGASSCSWLAFARDNAASENGQIFTGFYGGGQHYLHETLGTGNKYVIHVWRRDSGSGSNNNKTGNTAFVNGVSQTLVSEDTTCTPNVTETILSVGKDGVDNYLTANIGEIIIYDRALKTVEREEIEEYLSTKWGIKLQ